MGGRPGRSQPCHAVPARTTGPNARPPATVVLMVGGRPSSAGGASSSHCEGVLLIHDQPNQKFFHQSAGFCPRRRGLHPHPEPAQVDAFGSRADSPHRGLLLRGRDERGDPWGGRHPAGGHRSGSPEAGNLRRRAGHSGYPLGDAGRLLHSIRGGPRDGHLHVLQRLAQHFEHVFFELRQLVQEQDPVVG